jgi:hypothetical protein
MYSQNSRGFDLKFIEHLVKHSYFEEALLLLDSTDCSSIQTNDSIHYFRGLSLNSLNRLVLSSESFIKITPSSPFYLKSHFYAAYNYAQTGNFNEAKETLDKIEVTSKNMMLLKNFEIAGVELLQGKLSSFDSWYNIADKDQPEINEATGNLMRISAGIMRHKSKSPLIASLLSGIIPGSGKFYAGKRGEAISTFLSSAGFGLVTWENYRRNGINNFKTIAFGTAFAVIYIANIYGSAFSVIFVENQYKEDAKSNILFNLHIPISTIFNK